MKRYEVNLSDGAIEDLRDLFNVITYEYRTRRTAVKYIDGLFDTMNTLRFVAESFQLQNRPFFLKYGSFVYRVNYKKMAIIYTVRDRRVIIQRVMAASLITD